MKLLVCDVEGTIFKAKFKIDGTDYPSTMWQPIAALLGEAAIEEERKTHENGIILNTTIILIGLKPR